jgi:hypothetical protein
VVSAGLFKQSQAISRQVVEAAVQPPGELGTSPPVIAVLAVTVPHSVVEDREQQYDDRLGLGFLLAEARADQRDALPVLLTVHGGAGVWASGDHGVKQGLKVRNCPARHSAPRDG